MQIITGKYASVNVMTDTYEDEVYRQLLNICNQEAFKDSKMVVMPDCHSGKGSVIGFTMPLTHFVIPNLIGVDIGCGIDGYNLGKLNLENFNFKELDEYIRKNIPSGFSTHNSSKIAKSTDLFDKVTDVVTRLKLKDMTRYINSVGTTGGGNHFLELGVSNDQDVYLFIHSGSRNFGLSVATHYQKKAEEFIATSKIGGIFDSLEYLDINSKDGKGYLMDMSIAQEYALANRDKMAQIILRFLKPPSLSPIKTTHNYINFDDRIVRKGAIQANLGQKVVIPFNMRDGVIIGVGKGNSDWNNSAPHGAGRIYSRNRAKSELDLNEFQETMKDVWSSCVGKDTLDESPMAYKPKEEILKYVGETIDIIDIVKPVYNFKAS